jgi:hypothetical protein
MKCHKRRLCELTLVIQHFLCVCVCVCVWCVCVYVCVCPYDLAMQAVDLHED